MSTSVRPSPLAIVVGLFFLGNAGEAVCAAYAIPVPGSFRLLYYVGIAWGFSWWVLSDSRARGIPSFIDHGWFVFYGWPIAVPYYVLKTRGARGCGLLLALLGAFLATYVVSLGLYFLLART